MPGAFCTHAAVLHFDATCCRPLAIKRYCRRKRGPVDWRKKGNPFEPSRLWMPRAPLTLLLALAVALLMVLFAVWR